MKKADAITGIRLKHFFTINKAEAITSIRLKQLSDDEQGWHCHWHKTETDAFFHTKHDAPAVYTYLLSLCFLFLFFIVFDFLSRGGGAGWWWWWSGGGGGGGGGKWGVRGWEVERLAGDSPVKEIQQVHDTRQQNLLSVLQHSIHRSLRYVPLRQWGQKERYSATTNQTSCFAILTHTHTHTHTHIHISVEINPSPKTSFF